MSLFPGRMHSIGLLLLALALAGASARATISRQTIASGFSSPLYVTAPPGDTSRLFVVERGGIIKIIDLNTNTVMATPFLNVNSSSNTDVDTNDEGGLLSMAFHPNYASNGFFYVYYTTTLPSTGFTSRVSRFTVSANPNVANANSEAVFLEVDQPFTNHNGGTIAFKPGDNNNYLYFAMGDGGSGCDPFLNAQNLNSKLGKMLRINVDAGPSGDLQNPFAPPTNPYVGVAGDDLIWDLGLRNPFRWSFDRQTGDMYIADVGQGTREEIDFEAANSAGGRNYGWNAREGTIAAPCSPVSPTLGGMVNPIYDYDHNSGSASITGGNIYRGSLYGSMYGRYFFAEYVLGNVWSCVRSGASITDLQDHTATLNPGSSSGIVGFGEDAVGNIYIVSIGGTIYRIVDPASSPVDSDGDAIPDVYETNTGVYVSPTDTGSNPNDSDTDNDGIDDGTEVSLGTDPNNPLDFPTLPVSWGWIVGTAAAVAAIATTILVVRRREAHSA